MMSEQALATDPDSALRPTARVVNPSTNLELLAQQFESSWPGIGPAIALAGAAYPVVLAFGMSLVIIAALLDSHFPGGPVQAKDVGEGVVIVFLVGTVGAGLGLVWTSVVCVAILPLVYLFVLSLQLRGSLTR